MDYNWDLEKIYKNEEELDRDKEKIVSLIDNLNKAKDNEDFFAILDISQEINRSFDKLYNYAHMKQDENSKIPESQAMKLKADALYADVITATSFIAPYILGLDDSKLEEYKKDSRWGAYDLFLSRILRQKEHMLSKDIEYVMSAYQSVGRASGDIFYMLSNADITFPIMENTENKERLTHANFIEFLMDKNRDLRKEAFEGLYKTYRGFENTFASTFYGNLKNTTVNAKLRRFNSSIEAPLFEDNVPISVYENLISSIHSGLDTLYRYFAIKKRALGLDEFHIYDSYLSISSYDRKVEFDEAKEIVIAALEPLGEEYLSIIKKAFDERWIDVYPREGKRSGAYSSGSYDSYPYILLNYNNNLDSVFTLIHELGHSVHSYYSRKNNDFLYSDYTIFVAEVASTTNEMLLINYLLKNSKSEEERIYLLNYFANMFKSTVYRQTMFAEFEKIVHEKVEASEALNATEINKIYYELNELYFGKDVYIDKYIELEWARIPHFYTDFYVYKYATGLSAATVLSKNILSGDNEKISAYLNFLKDGNKHFPIDQLKMAGADMSKKDTVDSALLRFKEIIDELDSLIK